MKILVIEDEKLLADSIKSMLERKGFQVECVSANGYNTFLIQLPTRK